MAVHPVVHPRELAWNLEVPLAKRKLMETPLETFHFHVRLKRRCKDVYIMYAGLG